MMRDTSVLVGYRPDGAWRDAAWERIERWWEELGVELIVETSGPGQSPAEFNKPLAVNLAAAKATRRYLIIADADTGWTPGLPEALVRAVRQGAPWAMPMDYAKLTQTQTRAQHQRNLRPLPRLLKGCDWVGHSVSWSGLVCIAASDYRDVCGYDERFEWWGADDVCFGLTADALIGQHERVAGAAVHYWHPAPLDETYGHERHREQRKLMERYVAAAGDAAAIRAVRFSP